jgi:putative ABC transport system ATP-binding protein
MMPSDSAGPLIHLSRVVKAYQSGDVKVTAVRGVNLEVYRGDFVAIMGASGSGKSTLMNLLGCLDQPTTGSYLLSGVDVGTLKRKALATLRNEKLGFVFQSFNLLPRTNAQENVELPMLYRHPSVPGRVRREKALAALRSVGLEERRGHHPSQLSGGQQQRVAIARALVNHPELLLADEPTGNLDSRTSIEIMDLFQQLNDAGATIVMVTHEAEVAAYCRRTVTMRDGEIISDQANAERRFAKHELASLGDSHPGAAL